MQSAEYSKISSFLNNRIVEIIGLLILSLSFFLLLSLLTHYPADEYIASQENTEIHNIFGDEFFEKYGYPTPLGVKGRNSDNKLFREKVGWETEMTLRSGMEKTYKWIESEIQKESDRQK